MRTGNTNRRFVLLALLLGAIFTILFLSSLRNSPLGKGQPLKLNEQSSSHPASHSPPDLTGHAIAPKLGNETAKAELGRAAWKLFHTTFARFPDRPAPDESSALKTYIHLFQRLYPCGECAEHFGVILKKYPPQVSSRSAAAAWGCHVHNEVNKKLKKELFDCSNIGDFYHCGCAEDEKDKMNEEGKMAGSKLEVERDGWGQGG